MTVFISEAVGADRLPFIALRPPTTPRIRRWKRLAELYRQGFAAVGLPTTPILRPEIYQSDVAREVCHAKPGDWHMAIKPLEHLRPFHGLPNVYMCDWTHPRLSTSSGPGAPFLNHVRVLRRAEIVACCAEATARVVRQAGLPDVVHLPPFIGDADRSWSPAPRRCATVECVCLALMDADGPTHIWASLLQGFAMARRRNEHLRLLVAVEGTGTADLLRTDMLTRFAIDDVGECISFSAAPHDGVVTRMAPQADFFLDASPPDGFPIGSIQALRSGLPLIGARGVSVQFPDDTFVCMDTVRGAVPVSEEPAVDVMRLHREQPDALSICGALLTAAALPRPERLAMGEAGRRFAEMGYGRDAFATALHTMLGRIPGLSA